MEFESFAINYNTGKKHRDFGEKTLGVLCAELLCFVDSKDKGYCDICHKFSFLFFKN